MSDSLTLLESTSKSDGKRVGRETSRRPMSLSFSAFIAGIFRPRSYDVSIESVSNSKETLDPPVVSRSLGRTALRHALYNVFYKQLKFKNDECSSLRVVRSNAYLFSIFAKNIRNS